MNTQLNAVNTQIDNPNAQKLMTLLEEVKPIFNELGKILADSKKLDSKYKHHLNHLNLYLKMDNTKEHYLMTEAELEERVSHIGFVLEGIGKIMTEISKDREESTLYLNNGIIVKFQEIAQKLVRLVSL